MKNVTTLYFFLQAERNGQAERRGVADEAVWKRSERLAGELQNIKKEWKSKKKKKKKWEFSGR